MKWHNAQSTVKFVCVCVCVFQSSNYALYTSCRHMEASEGLRTQIGLQKQLHAQLEVCISSLELARKDVRTFIYLI